ncbi:MAG: hypothetical protein EA381_14140 [Planctomycetaceae bacterium]|nr:MAG: hypothetical protein EA381_14140 [Planctomycetaceae bacterium]
MARNNKFAGRRTPSKRNRQDSSSVVTAREAYVKKEPVEYGKPFIVMEDAQKNTFAYDGTGWNPYPLSIAECRTECLVKELPQNLNGKTRYEVRAPIKRV